jgi:hypothetical protein
MLWMLVITRQLTHPQEALKDASFIIHAVPVQYSRKFLEDIAPHMPKNTPIISTSKVGRKEGRRARKEGRKEGRKESKEGDRSCPYIPMSGWDYHRVGHNACTVTGGTIDR